MTATAPSPRKHLADLPDHARVWARHMTVADPAHVAVAQQLREDFAHPRARDVDSALVRDLADYDRAFGIDAMEVA